MNTMTEWRSINLGKLEKDNCLLMRNGFPCGSNNQHEIGVPQLRPMNIDNFGEIDLSSIKFVETDKNIKIYLIKENDIIFNNTNSKDLVGKTVIWNKESNIYVLSNHMTLLRFDSNCGVDPEFIAKYFYLLWINNYFQRVRRQHVNQASISLERLRDLEIPLPPLPEQRAIARALRAVQGAREARLRELVLERERKAALMEHLFTHGTRGEATKMTEIGEMPESWEVVKLGDLLREKLKNGHSAKVSNSDKGIRTLTLTAVTKNDFSITNTKITVADPEYVRDLWIKPGDIFIERANTPEFVGLASLYQGPIDFAIFPDLMVRVRLKTEEVNPKYAVEFLLTEPTRSYFRRNAASTTGNMPKIDQGIIERTQIPIPGDFQEQNFIADILKACDSRIAALEHEARLLQELFRAMLEELMSGRLPAGALVEDAA